MHRKRASWKSFIERKNADARLKSSFIYVNCVLVFSIALHKIAALQSTSSKYDQLFAPAALRLIIVGFMTHSIQLLNCHVFATAAIKMLNLDIFNHFKSMYTSLSQIDFLAIKNWLERNLVFRTGPLLTTFTLYKYFCYNHYNHYDLLIN